MFKETIIICSSVILSVFGGCSFKDHMDSTQSAFKDLDQAKFAAKMALAHQGLDIETLKKRQARYLFIVTKILNQTSEKFSINQFNY